MTIRSLKGFTAEDLMAFVEKKNGPDGQIPSWLDQRVSETDDRTLRSFLKMDTKRATQPQAFSDVVLSLKECLSPLSVPPRLVAPEAPPLFCAPVEWLSGLGDLVLRGLSQEDTSDGSTRVSPIVLVRCSRGGKTRSLIELNKWLREKRSDVAVVHISFNDSTPVRAGESSSPVDALCRRIMFEAYPKEAGVSFDDFGQSMESAVLNWLKDTPCILLIDELNVLDVRDDAARVFAMFLKTHFLTKKNRFFVFSSHVLPSGNGLSDFMDSMSERGVLVEPLPLIPSLEDARAKFQFTALSGKQALFRGRIPALVFVTMRAVPQVFVKRDDAIRSVTEKGWTNDIVLGLLWSFLDGDRAGVPRVLWQIMNAGTEGKILWIPFHMVHVLRASVKTLSPQLRETVNAVCQLLEGLETGGTSDGKTWEELFVAAILIRIATGTWHDLLPLMGRSLEGCATSYNFLWTRPAGGKALPDITTLSELLAGLVEPFAYPHIAVFYPDHASFRAYDVIVVVFLRAGERLVYGYQLKEGAEIPDKIALLSCTQSFVVRGKAAQSESLLREWTVVSDEQIDSFLGESGKVLAPKIWRDLKD